MSVVVPFSYNYLLWLGQGGQTTPGLVLFNAASYLLTGYLIQVRGVALETTGFDDGSNPTLTAPDNSFNIGNNYSFSNNTILAGIANLRSGGTSPANNFIWPSLVTVAQFGLINLPASGSVSLSGRLCLWFNPTVFSLTNFLISGYVRIA